MLEALTLEELKAQNAAEEEGDEGESQSLETETESKAEEGEGGETTQEAEPGEEAEKPESDAWQSSDDEGSQTGEQFVPVAAHVKLRAKLKDKISEKDAELEALKAKTAELERKLQANRSESSKGDRPKPEDYDTDEAYEKARDDWLIQSIEGKRETERQQALREQAEKEQNARVSEVVDAHYTRAAKLAEENNIPAEKYQSADMAFRSTIDSAFPGTGDALADQLIARMGEGSEKLVYYIGRSRKAQAEVGEALKADPTGLSVSILLGRMMAEKVNGSGKRASQAPTPAATANGDVSVNADARALKKAYDKASKSGNPQAAIDARLAARRKGLDVSTW